MYPGTRINEINDGRIHAKRIEGKHSDFIIVDEVIGTDEVEPVEIKKKLIGINRGYGFMMFHTYKRWYKKRKGKRWVWYYEIKPRLPYKFEKLKFGYSKKKPRGKKAKEWRKIVKFYLNFMKNFRVDYTQYDNLYPSCVTPIKPDDETKFKVVVTKRIDEIKGEE